MNVCVHTVFSLMLRHIEREKERNKLDKFRNHYAYSVTFWSHCAKFEDTQLDSFTQFQKKKKIRQENEL